MDAVTSCVVTTADALDWLPTIHGRGAVATSPPDASEVGMATEPYVRWLRRALVGVFSASTGPTVLVVTDHKGDGQWLSKPAVIDAVANSLHVPLLWHRIALRRPVRSIDLRVPTYSHVLAYGPGRPGKARPDVFDRGTTLWRNGFGIDLADYIAEWMAEVGVQTLVDPFCGSGILLRAANAHGMDALGCDLDSDRADEARDLVAPMSLAL